jgi:hypothetical protein
MSMITTLTALVAVLMLVIPLAAEAQPQAQVARIGVLSLGSPATSVASLDAFRQRLRELGYAEAEMSPSNLAMRQHSPDGFAVSPPSWSDSEWTSS